MRRRLILWLFVTAFLVVAPSDFAQSGQFGDASSSIHSAPQRSYDVQHYDIALTISFEDKSIDGSVDISLKPLSDGLDRVVLDSSDLLIRTAEVEGRTAPFRVQSSKVSIDLDRPYASNETIHLKIYYSGHPKQGLYWVGGDPAYPDKPAQVWSQGEDEDSRFWFPCYDFPDDKATTDTIITVRKPFMVISNGDLVEVRDGGASRTYHWKMDRPHSTYLTSIVAGDFEEYTDTAGNVQVAYYVPRGTGKETALRSFGRTPEMIRYFGDLIGIPYPYSRYSQVTVADFIFGGMENITATTQTLNTLHDERAQLDYPSESLVAHELAHQWWGDLVTPADWSQIWLSEGFATYFEALYTRKAQGEEAFRYKLFQDSQKYFQEDSDDYRRPVVSALYTDPVDVFDQHAYVKGAWVLAMLQDMLGDDVFRKLLREWGTRYAYGNATTDQLRALANEVSGRNLDTFFAQWLHGTGFPEFVVEWAWLNGEAQIHVLQVQHTENGTPVFDVPVKLEFELPNGTVQSFTVSMNQMEQTLNFALPERPIMVRFDPDNAVLKKITFVKTAAELKFQANYDPNVIGRIQAVEALASLDESEDPAGTLIDVLAGDSFPGVRVSAAAALGRIHDDRAWNALNQATRDEDSNVRKTAINALSSFPFRIETQAVIRRVLEQDQSYAVQAAAALAIGRIRADGALEILTSVLDKESHNDVVRRNALNALVQVGPLDRVRPIVLEWTTYGRNPETRITAIALLARLTPGSRAEIVQRLVDLLSDPWMFAREAAINALGALRAPEALGPLEASAELEIDGRLRQEARAALARIRTRPAAPAGGPTTQ